MPEHLEVLRAAPARAVRVERVAHADAVDRHLRHAAQRGRRRDADAVEHRGQHVDHAVELRAHAARGDARRPADDQRVDDATGVRVLLVALERGVARLRPADRIVVARVARADVVDAREVVRERLRVAVLVERRAGRAVHLPFLAGAVVRQQDEHRVVEPPEALEVADEPAEVVIGVVEEAGERLLEACVEAALVRAERAPRLDAGVARRELRVRRHDAERLLPRETLGADHVPARVVASAILVDERGRRLVRRMRRTGGEVQEERLVRRQRHLVGHERDRVVDEVLVERVALSGRARRAARSGCPARASGSNWSVTASRKP